MRSRTKLTDKIKLSEFDMAGIIEKWLIHHHVEVENFFYNWPESRSLILDAMVLSKINADMIEYVIEKPEKVLEMVRGILLSDAVDNPTDSFIDFPEIRIRNIPNRITPSGIRDGDVGTLVAVECQVRSASKILPKAKVVFVRCVRCGHVWNVDVPYRGDPSVHVCPNNACNRTGPFTFIDEREVRTSSERFIIQDPFDAAVGSATAAFEMEVEGDLVDCARAGDRIIANCIVCTEKKSKSPIRSIYLKCISVETDTNAFDDKPLTKEEIGSFQALGEQGILIPQIVKSIAPDIYGMEDVKEAIALQLASCPSVPMDGGMKLRGDIHIFLIGDPGIAKSQLLRYVSKIAHRGRYTSGRGSTSAGLCVAGDSLIWVEGELVKIGDFAEKYFHHANVTCPTSIKLRGINQFKDSNAITHIWKIPAPAKLLKVITRYGEVKVPENTKLMTSEGWKTAGELQPSDVLEVPSYIGGWYEELPSLVDLYPSNVKIKNRSEIFKRIMLNVGSKKDLVALGISEFKVYHSWMHDDSRGAMTLGEIRTICGYFGLKLDHIVGDVDLRCQIRHGHMFTLPTRMSNDMAYFMGLISGDGSFDHKDNHAVIRFCKNCCGQNYTDLVMRLFGQSVHVIESSELRGKDFRFGNLALYRLLVGSGINRPLGMRIPSLVIKNKSLLSSYLRGLMDTDGSVYRRRDGRVRVEFSSIYGEFAEQVRHALMRFGIISTIRKRPEHESTRKDGKKIKSKALYVLEITNKEDIKLFADEIGFAFEHKRERLAKYIKDIGLGVKNRRVMAKVLEISHVDSPDKYVYDLTIAGTHSFVANGLLVHNTATAVKDEDDRWSVEAGFLPLCHDGLAAIDEFNLMKAEDRSALLEAMESGTVSVSKASISATLPAKATILAAGNPVNSRIDVHVPIVEQINIPTTILSRFDLIFILLDSHNKEQDEALAHHIGALRRGTKSSIDPPISLELLRRYISHVKKLNDFQVTEEAEKMLIDFHLGMRSFNDYKGAVPVTPRQLEAMFRLATASARLRMSPSVEKQDAERAIRLSRASLLSSGIDPESGALDADAIYTGVPKSQADATKVIEDAIVELSKNGGNAKLADIISEAARKGIKPDRVEKILDRLRSNGNIFSPSDNTYRHTWRR